MMPIHSSEIQGTDDLEPLSGSPNPLYGDVVCFAIKRAACRQFKQLQPPLTTKGKFTPFPHLTKRYISAIKYISL